MLCLCCFVLSHSVCLSLCDPWTIAHKAALSIGFSRQEYWSGWLYPPLGDLPNLGIEPTSPTLAGGFFTTKPPGKPPLFPGRVPNTPLLFGHVGNEQMKENL